MHFSRSVMKGTNMAMEEGNKEPTSAMESEEKSSKEGTALLGSPTFVDLGNGRFKCVETGHELLPKDMESYGTSKRCRLGLIDYALQQRKTPLNLFKQHPNFTSKVICKLTGDTINKSEEHIWKHINGRRFMHKLEEKEANKGRSGVAEKNEKPLAKLSKLSENGTKKKKKETKKKDTQEKKSIDENSNEEDPMFWSPPVGNRWDFDDGNDCRESCSSDHEMDEDIENADEESQNDGETDEPTMRTKRASKAVELSSSTSRKKNRVETYVYDGIM